MVCEKSGFEEVKLAEISLLTVLIYYVEVWPSGYGIVLVIPRSGISVEVTAQC